MITTLKELLEFNKSQELYEYVKEQMIELYNQLSPCSSINNGQFHTFVMSTNPILCVGDNFKILGTLSTVYEMKMIHNGGIVCRLEDLVVDEESRNQGIATQLIERAVHLAKEKNAYKIVLDCVPDMMEFYKKQGFTYKNIQMSWYLNEE